MSYQLTLTPKAGYLHAKIQGDNTPESMRGYLADIREACIRLRCADVLIEEHLLGPSIGTFQVFSVVTGEAGEARGTVGRVAFVDTNPEHDSSIIEFGESVARNRGVFMRAFATVREAEEWLSGPRE